MFFTTFELSLTPFKIIQISINARQLAIATSLYPIPLLPRLLTQTHIAAIQIHTHHANPHFSTEHISGVTIADGTVKLIRQAQAYGGVWGLLQQSNNRAAKGKGYSQKLPDVGMEVHPGMDMVEFRKYIRNYSFMIRLDFEGESAQREVLEAYWRAYEQVPRHVKVGLGLFFPEEDDGEAMVNGMNGENGVNGVNGISGFRIDRFGGLFHIFKYLPCP